jgi:nicotinamide-nucleotide amidase
MLMRSKTTIAAAESCTGGLIAHKLTNVPGVSAVLLESVVTYSNASKMARLGVAESTLRAHGAVSSECAREMAEGVARTSGAAVGVATTGIAGPTGGTATKPVGLVYHAVAFHGRTRVERRVFPGERTHVKERAANLALDLVRRALLGWSSEETGATCGRERGSSPRPIGRWRSGWAPSFACRRSPPSS